MYGLPDLDKRGRPDIIHFCLLAALSSPLNKQGYLRVWVNTLKSTTIEINPIVNLPRGYSRFQSLMEQLLIKNRVPPESKNPLLKTYDGELCDLKKKINPSSIIALTSHGEPSSLDKLSQELTKEERPMVLIGAYPHGPMSNETLTLADKSISIYQDTLEAWVVTSRLIYEYEKQSGLI
jgi:rRNA small subunit pseudouridine methyltransferase Nep1